MNKVRDWKNEHGPISVASVDTYTERHCNYFNVYEEINFHAFLHFALNKQFAQRRLTGCLMLYSLSVTLTYMLREQPGGKWTPCGVWLILHWEEQRGKGINAVTSVLAGVGKLRPSGEWHSSRYLREVRRCFESFPECGDNLTKSSGLYVSIQTRPWPTVDLVLSVFSSSPLPISPLLEQGSPYRSAVLKQWVRTPLANL